MKKIKSLIAERTRQYESSDFIQFLQNREIPARKRLSYLPYSIYFVMTFADINRMLFPHQAESDTIQEMINTHGEEDSTHWPWSLHDMEVMGYNRQLTFTDAIKLIWSKEATETRRYCYTLIKYCSDPDPLIKLVAIEALEAMGKPWLDNSVAVAREMDLHDKLIYLGQYHSEREIGHAIGTEADQMDEVVLPERIRGRAEHIVNELFDGMEAFNNELLLRVEKQDHNKYVDELQAE